MGLFLFVAVIFIIAGDHSTQNPRYTPIYIYVSQGFSRVKTRPGVGSESFQVLAGRVGSRQQVFETSRVSPGRVSSVLGYVHSARASWVSYVGRPGTLLRPLGVLLAGSLTLPPSTPALSQFVFVSIFLHSSRFPFSGPFSLANLRK